MHSSVTSRLFTLCCLLPLIAGCSRILSDHRTSGEGTSTASVKPRGDLIKAMSAMLNAKSYRAHMDSSTANGTTSTMVLEFVAPDRYHMTRESELVGKENYKQDTIVIGKETWMKMGDTPWRKFPVNVGGIISQFRDPKTLDEVSRSAEVKFIGPDVVNGSPTLVYQYDMNFGQNQEVKTTTKTWVGMTDGLPRKTESEGDMGMNGKQVHTKTTVIYSDFNGNIKIEPPM